MIPQQNIDQINSLRNRYFSVLERLASSTSFQALLASSSRLCDAWRRTQSIAAGPRARRVCDGTMAAAIIGGSSNGKTTVLKELFPDLDSYGWLEAASKDCTAQSLKIHCAGSQEDLGVIKVRSYSADELRRFIQLSEEDCRRNNVEIEFGERSVIVDGSRMSVSASEAAKFRFPKRVTLQPFATEYRVDGDQTRDPQFIRSLTTKDAKTGPILSIAGISYDALQLRALVKEVSLSDPYTRLRRLANGDADVSRLVFIDTPGQGTASAVTKDEVLFHCLGAKARHIAVQLWQDDELDFLVHLVLCGTQSAFQDVWAAILKQVPPDEAASLEERLVLLVNGTSRFDKDDNIRKLYEHPETAAGEDQFQLVLRENILDKMSPHGRLKPAAICFVDTLFGMSGPDAYAREYARLRPVMESWCEPGQPGYDTLKEFGLVDSFRENIQSLCDANDRGHSYFLRTLTELARARGPQLLVRKHLIRSRIAGSVDELASLLPRFYDADGTLSSEAYRESVRRCLEGLTLQNPRGIERFAMEQVDGAIDDIVAGVIEQRPVPHDWCAQAYDETCLRIRQAVLARATVSQEAAIAFETGFENLALGLRDRWGYSTCVVRPPDRRTANTGDLIRHTLKLHAREILFLLISDEQALGMEPAPDQDDADRANAREILSELNELRQDIHRTCQENGGEK